MKKFFLVVVAFAVASPLLGGVTGKIAGRVMDKSSGEELPSVNVMVEEAKMGGVTNLQGEYYVLNVPPGVYNVEISLLGYKTVIKKEVRVSADLTTTINFELEPVVLQGEEVTVTAKRPMIMPDITATSHIIEAKQIDRQPVHSQADIIAQQAGVVNSSGGASGVTGGLHIRGGRADEIAYMVDGMSINDPIVGGAGAQVSMSAVKEVAVTTGGFNAEYGQAMSGLVNLVTKEGRDFEGLLRTQSDRLLPNNEGNNRTEISFGGPFPLHRKLQYFFSGEMFSRDNLEGWENSSIKEWLGESGGNLPDICSSTGRSNTDRDYYSTQGKVTYKFKPTMKLSLGGFLNRTQYGADGSVSERYCMPRYRPVWFQKASQFTATLTQSINPSNFYTLMLGRFNTHSIYGKRDVDFEKTRSWWQDYKLLPWWYDISYSELSSDYDAPGWYAKDENGDFYYPYGVPGVFKDANGNTGFRWRGSWYERSDDYYGTKLDFTSQIGTHHQVKFGVGGNYHTLVKRQEGQYISSLPPDAVKIGIDDSSRFYIDSNKDTIWYKYSDYGKIGDSVWVVSEDKRVLSNCLYYDDYQESPKEANFYIQDKVEYPGFILNAGVRFDWFDANTWKLNNVLSPYNPSGLLDTSKVAPKFQVSPRFGISFPVTDRTVFRLSYGHFFQMARMRWLYDSYKSPIMPGRGAWGLVGSPDLDAERTIQYEMGIAHQLTSDMALSFSAFYKDIYELVGARYIPAQPTGFTMYVTEDYGNVEGVELSLEKQANDWLSGRLTYTLSFAKGTSSYEREAYYDFIANVPVDPYTGEAFVLPRTVYALEFDQRHIINAELNFNIPERIRFIGNTNINTVTQFGSGLPWTERDTRGYLVGERNAHRLLWNENTDLKFKKDFTVFKKQKFYLFAEITNLFNRKDILTVFEATGKTDDDGLFQDFATYIDQTFPKEYKTAGSIPVYTSGGEHSYQSADPRRDFNNDGYITESEWYESYKLAYKDFLTGYGEELFSNPRKISIGIAYNW